MLNGHCPGVRGWGGGGERGGGGKVGKSVTVRGKARGEGEIQGVWQSLYWGEG